jgi:hypothetical protein
MKAIGYKVLYNLTSMLLLEHTGWYVNTIFSNGNTHNQTSIKAKGLFIQFHTSSIVWKRKV